MKTLFYLNILRKGAGMINREAAFANQLSKFGHEVTILSYFKPTLKVDRRVNVEYVFGTKYIGFLYNQFLCRMIAFFSYFMVILIKRPDVVMVDLPREARMALRLRKLFDYKIVFTYHGVADDSFYEGKQAVELRKLRSFCHEMLKRVDKVLVVSDFLLQEMQQIGVNAETLYNGFDEKIWSKNTKLMRDHRIVTFVGRFTEYKGAFNIVRAFDKVVKKVPMAKLKLYGYFESPEYINKIRQFIETWQLEKNISLHGPLNEKEMVNKVSRSAVFVNGSTDETFCMPLLEAQAIGTPCVAFAAGGIPEVVNNGVTGLLADPDNVDHFAAAIIRLLEDKDFYRLCQINTVKHIQKFNYKFLTKHLRQILIKTCDCGNVHAGQMKRGQL